MWIPANAGHWQFKVALSIVFKLPAALLTYAMGVGVRGGAVGRGTALQAGRSRVRFPKESLEFFSRIVAVGSTQPVTEMSTWKPSWGLKAAGA
jgi:hypothetical protein